MESRASDDDRRRTVAALERHAGAGRLTADELAERARVADGAQTMDELNAVVRDLPAEPAAVAPGNPTEAVTREPGRELYLLFAIAAATLVLLAFFIALTR